MKNLEDKVCPAINKEQQKGCLFPYEICHRQGTKYTCQKYNAYLRGLNINKTFKNGDGI